MFTRLLLTGSAALFLMGAAPITQQGSATQPSPQEVLDAAPASAWMTIPAEDLVVMTLADGSVVEYQLAPDFAPAHVANIRQLVRSGYFDGASILRVQDAYVVQWGRADEDKTEAKGINPTPPAEYEFAPPADFKALPYRDAYAEAVGHVKSWPVASDGKSDWLVHCYGMIGVARDVAPDTGSGTQLYTVIGHAPRHLDRNLAVVGRVINGMEFLTDRPRGTEELGFYKDDTQRIKIVSVKMAADLPAEARPSFQVLDSDSPTFAAWVKARANRSGAFFVKPAGAVDLCNALAPVRGIK
ncbi:MAG: peptidylprolyl isomerase [Asticcacaulis sp.]|uniref:peptidylprolyl isomerase n=1 Tax=Asticcacaulis sp. TaxID=1872648 RepID=UPI0039E65E27